MEIMETPASGSATECTGCVCPSSGWAARASLQVGFDYIIVCIIALWMLCVFLWDRFPASGGLLVRGHAVGAS